jgi:CRP/FNR family transcriptional regulator, dissimilatory nitrate respiration regulator
MRDRLPTTRYSPDPHELRAFERRTGIAPEDLDLVAHTPLFAGLDRSSLVAVLAEAAVRRFGRHDLLFLQDEPATRFYVVLDGWVRLYRETADGNESVIAVFSRGETFAEAAILRNGVYPVNAEVVDDARLLVIPSGPFLRQLHAHHELCLNMMASMAVHLRRLVQQIEQVKLRSSVERLADFLVRLSPPDMGSAVVDLPCDKSLIASRLGMQPETLSRSLAKLRRLGVDTRGSQIVINDLSALRRLSERTAS